MNVICMFFYEKGYKKKCNKKCVLVYGWDGYLIVFILIKVFIFLLLRLIWYGNVI